MTNEWYNHAGWPAQDAAGDSASARAELDAITTAFNKLPGLSGLALRLIRVNAAGTALEAAPAAATGVESYTDAQAGTHTLLTNVAGTNTVTATATPTLASYTTGERFAFLATAANTGATTLNVDGAGPISLVHEDGSVLVANDILGANYPCLVFKRAADFVLMNPYISANLGMHSAVSKTTPIGADEVSIWDSITQTIQKLTFTNLIAYLGTLYLAIGGNAVSATTAGNLSGTPALPNGTTATTQAANDNSTKLATTAYADTAVASANPTGTIIDFAGTAAPAGYLVCPLIQTDISRATYAALFAAIGTTWGAGNGTTTFGMPWFAANYAAVAANANVGTTTVGAVIAHAHTEQYNTTGSGGLGVPTSTNKNATPTSAFCPTASTGGAANLAAGVCILKCVKL